MVGIIVCLCALGDVIYVDRCEWVLVCVSGAYVVKGEMVSCYFSCCVLLCCHSLDISYF